MLSRELGTFLTIVPHVTLWASDCQSSVAVRGKESGGGRGCSSRSVIL